MSFIQFIKTPSQNKMILEDKWYLPLELIWIGTYLQEFGHEVEVLDGQLLSVDEIKRKLYAPIVGINFHIYSASNLDELVETAKARGSLVIVGGQAATPLAEQLLAGNEAIDAVICNDGEEALRQIADSLDSGRCSFAGIPNVVYRSNGKIIRNDIKDVPVCNVPVPDRRLKGINIEDYIGNFQKSNTFLNFNGKRVTNAHTKKGCPRHCSFCGRVDKRHRGRNPQQVFDEYRYLTEKFEVDYIFDHSDTWAVDYKWLQKFEVLCEKSGGFGARLSVFADLRDLSLETINILRSVGVDTVETGIESGHEAILTENHKRMQKEDIIERIMALTNAGIKVDASYVLGILGETIDSVQETIDLSRRLYQQTNGNIRNYFNIIFPLPGTMVWKQLLSDPSMQEKYGNDYNFNIEDLRRDYLRRHCNLGYDAYEFLLDQRSSILAENALPVMEYAR